MPLVRSTARRPSHGSSSGERRVPAQGRQRSEAGRESNRAGLARGHGGPTAHAGHRDHRGPARRDDLVAHVALLSPRSGASGSSRRFTTSTAPTQRESGGIAPTSSSTPTHEPRSKLRPTCSITHWPQSGQAAISLEATRFVVLLREPAERALSHYQFQRKKGRESETFARALELEESRLEGAEETVARGERSRAHRLFSYRSRGLYAEQLTRWFAAVGRERILIMESERLFGDLSAQGELLNSLDLSPMPTPFPALNATAGPSPDDAATRDRLRGSFDADNEALFDLLGRRFWARSTRPDVTQPGRRGCVQPLD